MSNQLHYFFVRCSRLSLLSIVGWAGIFTTSFAQHGTPQREKIIRMSSAHTSFPDTGRIHGHLYDGILYDAAAHYRDSSVMVIFPAKLPALEKLNMVFWFHGWNNNIDTASNYYHLVKQFLDSRRNAVLVFAETAKNSPDSYGGKLEQPGVFAALVNDILLKLKKEKLIAPACEAGNLVLAGHSGAFRVIAHILEYGGLPVREVQLFDALYSQTDKFNNWIQKDPSHRFINWYTNQGGGTDEVSVQMMVDLKKQGIPLLLLEEPDLNPDSVRANRILFIHSARAHNDIIFHPDNFQLLLENSGFLPILVGL